MIVQRSTLACAAVLAASMSVAHAGPCSSEITRMRNVINTRIDDQARAARAPQSTEATMHRQPTPRSVAGAEVKLGIMSPELYNSVKAAMTRASDADLASDRSACEQAVADVKRLLGLDGTQTDGARR
jgi:hypothetical protein